MNIGRAANSEPFHFNFDIGNAPYIRHVNQVQEIIWVFPGGVFKKVWLLLILIVIIHI